MRWCGLDRRWRNPGLWSGLLLFLAGAASLALAREVHDTYDRLVTRDGTVYEQVTVVEVEPDGVRILHRTGGGKIAYYQLPPELIAKYRIDSTTAEAYAKEQRQRQAEETRRQLEEVEQRTRLAQLKQRLAENAVDAEVTVLQIIDGGPLCQVTTVAVEHYQVTRTETPDTLANKIKAKKDTITVTEDRTRDVRNTWDQPVRVAGLPEDIVDGDTFHLTLYPMGRYQYTDHEGMRRTVRTWGPLEAAFAYYNEGGK